MGMLPEAGERAAGDGEGDGGRRRLGAGRHPAGGQVRVGAPGRREERPAVQEGALRAVAHSDPAFECRVRNDCYERAVACPVVVPSLHSVCRTPSCQLACMPVHLVMPAL